MLLVFSITGAKIMAFLTGAIIAWVVLRVLHDRRDPDKRRMIKSKTLVIPEETVMERLVIQIINELRTSNGLDTLVTNSMMKALAGRHTKYMICQNHITDDWFYVRNEFLLHELNAKRVAEMVSTDFKTAEDVVIRFMSSEKSLMILNGDFTHVDLCIDRSKDGESFMTILFVRI